MFGCKHGTILFSTQRLEFVGRHLVLHAFDNLIPLVGRFILKLGEVFYVDVVEAVVGASKERRQVIFESFLVRFAKGLCELLHE
jgi:hypothetical protein